MFVDECVEIFFECAFDVWWVGYGKDVFDKEIVLSFEFTISLLQSFKVHGVSDFGVALRELHVSCKVYIPFPFQILITLNWRVSSIMKTCNILRKCYHLLLYMKNLYTGSGIMNRLLNRNLADDVNMLTLILPYLSLRDLARFSMVSNPVKDTIATFFGTYEDFRDRLIQHFDLNQCVVCHVWRRDLFLESCGFCEEPICENHNDGRHCHQCAREFCNDCIESYLVMCEQCMNDVCVNCAVTENGYNYICNSCEPYL